VANTKSAEKASRQAVVHRRRNDAATSRLRSAIRKATLALKSGKHDEAATARALRINQRWNEPCADVRQGSA